jgi:hypothetical protein
MPPAICINDAPAKKVDGINCLYCKLYFRMGMSGTMKKTLAGIFTLDLRALSLMRIGVALLVIIDLFIRAGDLSAHYSGQGVLPVRLLLENAWNPMWFSFHLYSDMWQMQGLLFLIAAVAALFLMVGYHTRWATIVSWLLMISLHNRNPLINQGGDDLLRIMLFWGIFLPWDRFFSVRSLRQKNTQTETRYAGMAGAGYMLLVAGVYYFSGLIKYSDEWITDATAVYYALSLDQIVLPMGRLLYPYPSLLQAITLIVIWTEIIVPWMLFIPFGRNAFRYAALLILLLMHIGIAMTLYVGLFNVIGVVTLIGLLPSTVMDRLSRRTHIMKEIAADLFDRLRSAVAGRIVMRLEVSQTTRLRGPLFQGIRDVFLLVVIVYCIFWNLGNLSYWRYPIPSELNDAGYFLRLDQNWGMFAPTVFKDDGWYVLEGTAMDGRTIDLNRKGKAADYAKPASVVSMFRTDRWRKFSENFLFISHAYLRPTYCRYLMRTWNTNHPEKAVRELKVVYMKEVTAPDYRPVVPQREVLCECR